MAKKRKRTNRRLKKTARRALAAVLMITAIIIAMVPTPEIKADSLAYTYPDGVTNSINDETIDTDYALNLTGAGGAPKVDGSSYTIRKLGNIYQYDRQFDYYKAVKPGDPATAIKAVISGYNSTYNATTVSVPSYISTGYETVSETDLATKKGTPGITSYTLSQPTGSTAWFFEKYDSANFSTFKTAYEAYEAAMDAYDPSSGEPIPTAPTDLTKDVSSLTDEQWLSYYCDLVYKPLGDLNYSLVKVLNGNDNTWLYIPRGGTSTPDLNDSAGFLMSGNIIPVIAIGNKAFKDTQNVQNLDMSTDIKYVGDEAFLDSWVQKVDFGNASSIGNRAFKNCSRLTQVSFNSGITTIGAEAFYGTYLTSLSFPSSVGTIGEGAFAECQRVTSVDLSHISKANSEVKQYAFYNDIAINTLNMEGSSITKIATGAFAAKDGVTGSLTEFKYPSGISDATALGDYTIAGRTNLKKVTMPANYGRNTAVELPNGTFANCVNLQSVTFPDDGSGSCGQVSFKVNSVTGKTDVFKDITNEDFCVYGPEKDIAANKAKPRTSTWLSYSQVKDTVPYIYKNSAGLTCIEISDGGYLLTANQNGQLESCTSVVATDTSPIPELVIPAEVGGYTINTINNGCFDEAIKDRIQKLTIEDGSVETIADNTFSGCDNLTTVHIGNSVKTIGKNAFKSCPLLENVYFSTPESYTGFTMGEGAFETGSDKLTFHGDIVEGYAPFEWAMDYVIDPATSEGVCYKSNDPSNLTVMSYTNPETGNREVALVDYPFYENIDVDNAEYETEQDALYKGRYPTGSAERTAYDAWKVANGGSYSIIKKYENLLSSSGSVAGLQPYEILNQREQNIIDATKNITIPAGVTSIDAKDFFTQTVSNAGNISSYVQDNFGSTGVKKQTIYTGDGTGIEYKDIIHGGLFSGKLPEGTTTAETIVKGNDRVVSIALTDVTKLPDNAFDSCENLESIDLGACTDVGTAPFVGCDKLTNITSNATYTFENGILYKKNPDSTLTIVQCLPARGKLINPKTITVDSDPLLANVSAIDGGAFQNCDAVTKVDLSAATALQKIPEYTFDNCDNLNDVYLPETVNEILDNAFTQCPTGLTVEIPGTEVHITSGAFTHDQGIIRTYDDSAAYTYATLYHIDVETLGKKYVVSFVDYDGTALCPDQKVVSGQNAVPPTEPTRDGYNFTGWNKSYENITANTIIMAQYISSGDFKVIFMDYDGTRLSEQFVPAGGSATAPATPTRTGYTFTSWSDTFNNISDDKIIIACYTPIGEVKYQVTFLNYDATVLSTQYIVSGGNAAAPENPTRAGYTFTGWSGSYTNVTENRTLIAQFSTATGTNGANGTNGTNGTTKKDKDDDDDDDDDNNGQPTAHLVTVTGGSGGGYYTQGQIVYISAYAAPANKHFDKWTSTSNGVGIANVNSKATNFTMPNNVVTVVANYADGPETASSNNTVTDPKKGGYGGYGGRGSVSSNSTGTKPGGTVISITKPGFSDTDKASAVVHGSTDNYMIKITEDADAQAQIEAALLADAQTLENIKYFPMDISLYDPTGTTKITDTTGITVDITLPLPDELREYGGNNKVAGVVNGALDKLPPTFKSIDGVPCVTFTASHFSPYTIYVDTANLADGAIDSSPKTGDPIHPKWFLVIGLACISIILFAKRDVKRKIVIS